MRSEDRGLVHWALCSLMVAEERITTKFAGLVLAHGSEEEATFLATQQVDERATCSSTPVSRTRSSPTPPPSPRTSPARASSSPPPSRPSSTRGSCRPMTGSSPTRPTRRPRSPSSPPTTSSSRARSASPSSPSAASPAGSRSSASSSADNAPVPVARGGRAPAGRPGARARSEPPGTSPGPREGPPGLEPAGHRSGRRAVQAVLALGPRDDLLARVEPARERDLVGHVRIGDRDGVDVPVAPPVAIPGREPDAPQRPDHARDRAPAARADAEVDRAAAGVRGLRAAVGARVGALGRIEHAAAADEAASGPEHPDGADVERPPPPDTALARPYDADHAETTAGEPLERRLAGDAVRIEPGVTEPTLPGRIPGHRLRAEVAVNGDADASPAELPLHALDALDGAPCM